jgi:hypothetical protein
MLTHLVTVPTWAVRSLAALGAVWATTLIAHLFSRRSSPSPNIPRQRLSPNPKGEPQNQTYLMSRSTNKSVSQTRCEHYKHMPPPMSTLMLRLWAATVSGWRPRAGSGSAHNAESGVTRELVEVGVPVEQVDAVPDRDGGDQAVREAADRAAAAATGADRGAPARNSSDGRGGAFCVKQRSGQTRSPRTNASASSRVSSSERLR